MILFFAVHPMAVSMNDCLPQLALLRLGGRGRGCIMWLHLWLQLRLGLGLGLGLRLGQAFSYQHISGGEARGITLAAVAVCFNTHFTRRRLLENKPTPTGVSVSVSVSLAAHLYLFHFSFAGCAEKFSLKAFRFMENSFVGRHLFGVFEPEPDHEPQFGAQSEPES